MEATHRLRIWAKPWQRGLFRRLLTTEMPKDRRFDGVTYEEQSGLWHRLFVVKGSSKSLSLLYRVLKGVGERHPLYALRMDGVETLTPNVVEFSGDTLGGLHAVVLLTKMGHRCAYVGVRADHPLYGARYDVDHPALPCADNEKLGKKSPVLALTYRLGARSPETVFDVHGGITYSGPAHWRDDEPDARWYFGFDASHSGDAPEPGSEMDVSCGGLFRRVGGVVRDKQYMIDECDRLAEQLMGDKVRKVTPVERLLYLFALLKHAADHWLFRKRMRWAHRLADYPKVAKWLRGF